MEIQWIQMEIRRILKKREYFQKAINGETVISEIMDSRIIPDKEIQVIAVPIESENVVTGILFGILDTGTLNQEIGDLYLNHIYIQIVDSEGIILRDLSQKMRL